MYPGNLVKTGESVVVVKQTAHHTTADNVKSGLSRKKSSGI